MRHSTNVFIKISNDKIPVINLIPNQSEYNAGSNITLSCSVTYPYSSYIDVDTNLTLQWFNSSNDTLNSSTIINDNNEHTLTYTISNARLSDAGQYTCSFFINSSNPHIVNSNTTRNFTIINITIPNVLTPHTLVYPSKSYYNVNDSITLSCIINYTTNHLIDVNTTVNIQWLNDSLDSYTELNDHTKVAEHTFNYTINNLNLTNAGQYTCSFFFYIPMNSDVIKRSDMTSQFINITVMLPKGTIPSITISQDDPLFGVGSKAILSCSVYYAYSSFIDVDTTVHIEWKHNGVLLDSLSARNTFSNVSLDYHLSDVNNEEYTCESYLSATDEALAVPVVVGFIFFGIIFIIRGLKPSGVKVKSKELYTFSRELTKEDTDITETYALTDGVGCSGTFLTAYSQIERAKTEGVSDIFQFIRKARSQRPGLVDCLDQYIYCHEIIADFAEDMSQYDNFKLVVEKAKEVYLDHIEGLRSEDPKEGSEQCAAKRRKVNDSQAGVYECGCWAKRHSDSSQIASSASVFGISFASAENACSTISLSYNESIEVDVGFCLTFQCTLNDTVQWKLDGTDINNDDAYYNINTTSGTLTIQEVRSTDTGNYTCDLESTFLYVKIPNITIIGQYTNLTVGSSVSINCTTMPSISNSEIHWDPPSFNITNSNVLVINPVMLSHNSNTFTCTVSSDLLAMNLTESITISVLDTSVSSVTVQSLSSYVIGDDVSIVCTISLTNAIGPDVSSLVVNWFKDNEMTTDDINNINGSSSTFNSILTLTQVVRNNAGVYTCNASINGSNSVLSDSKPLCLKVPFNQNTDSFTDLSLGYNATVQCVNLSSLNGITIRSISWTDPDGYIIGNNSSDDAPISDNNTLILPNVVPSLNNTEYTCTAEVDTNPATCLPENKTFTIDTKRTYVNSIIIPIRLPSVINSSLTIESMIVLNIPVGPGIQPTVTWYHDMTNVTHYSSLVRDFDILFNSLLTIDSIQASDAGVYHCSAGIDSNVTTNNISICVTVNETLPSETDELSLGQYYSIDCITGTVPTGVSVSWLLTNGSINSNNNTLMIPSILPSHNDTQYNCTIMIETNPSDCSSIQSQTITFRVKATYISLVTITPTPIVDFINSSVVLTCTINLNTGIGPDTSFISHYCEGVSILPIVSVDNTSTSFVSTLRFNPITSSTPVSTLGTYTCVAWIGEQSVRNITSNNVQVLMKINNPRDVVSMTQLNEYTAGDSFNVSCMITAYQLSPPIATKGTVNIMHNDSVIRSDAFDIGATGSHERSLDIPFTNLKLSQSGEYTCFYNRSNNSFVQPSDVKSATTKLNIKIPTSGISLVHSPNESYYKVNNDVILSCKVAEPDPTLVDVETTAMVKWDSSNNISQQYSIHSYNEYFNYPLTSIKLSDAGEYNCTYYLNATTDNPYIKPSNIRAGVTNVIIKIPNGVSPSITQLNSHYKVGDSIDLVCSVTYPHSWPPIDIATNMNIQWLNSSNHTLHSYTGINNNSEHTISYTINNVSLSDAGEYTCQYNISSTNNSLVLPSDNMRASTNVSVKIPNEETPVISNQSVHDAGDDITLSCSVTYTRSSLIDVNTYLTLQLFNSSNDTLNSSTIINNNTEHTLTYTISNARLSDAGQYACSFSVNTSVPHIFTSNTTKSFIIISITIPNDITSDILVHPSKSYYNVNDSITLSCIIHYTTNHLIDVNTTVNIQWLNYSLDSYRSGLNDQDQHTFNSTISSLNLTDAGNYTCSFFISAPMNSNIIRSEANYNSTSIRVKIPKGKNPLVTQLESYYRVCDNIALTCSATYPSYIATNMNMQWLNSSNHTLHSYTGINNNTEHTISYTINNVSLSDAGEYACQYNISSNNSFVLPSDYVNDSIKVFIKIPNDKIPVINLIPHQSVYDTGSNITLSCSVTYPYSFYIDIDTNLTLQWFNSSNDNLNSSTIINDNSEHTLTYTISNARLSDAGQYTCFFFVNATVNNDVIHSETTSSVTNITIMLPRGTIPSITISQDDPLFGVGSNAILSCSVYYAYSSFIDVDTTVHIEWKHNGVLLESLSARNTFSNVSLDYHLSDVNNEEYTCESYLSATDEALAVPVVVGFIFFGIILLVIIGVIALIICDGVGCSGTFLTAYSQIERAKTEGVSDIFQFVRKARSQRPGLVDCLAGMYGCGCWAKRHSDSSQIASSASAFGISFASSAEIQWKLNGNDIINDAHNIIDTASGTLTIQEVESTDSGDYTCGGLGSIHLIVTMPGDEIIKVTGQYTDLTVGSSVSINCTTVPSITNSVIQWHSSSLTSDNNELVIDPVMLSHNNITFTCEVSSGLLDMNLTKSITISVLDTLTVHLLPSYVIGDDVSIECTISLIRAIGPSLVVNWFKDNEMEKTDNISINVSSSTFNSTLTITNVSSTDAGVYTCNASINPGSNSPLTDSKPLCLKDLVPFNEGNDNFTDLSLGYSAIVQCVNFSSFNETALRSIKWTAPNGTIVSNNNILTLPNVVPSLNNTEYTCTAEVNTNPATCLPDSKTITINTKRTYVSSIIMSSHESFLINSPFKIECTIILNTLVGPGIQPTVTWYHDMTNVTHNSSLLRNNVTVFTSTLTINSIQVSDAGVYHCNAGIDSNVTTSNIKVPDIVVIGQYINLTVGSSISINCTTMPSIPESEIKWDPPSSINSDSNLLIIDPVMLSHNNKAFTCEVSSGLLAMDLTMTITISVLDTRVSSVTVQSLPSYVIGENVSIVCTISLTNAIGPDVSSLVVNWFKNNEMIPTDNINNINVSSSTFNSILTLTQVSPTDAGVYTCNASITGSDKELTDSKPLCLQVPFNQNTDSYTDLLLGYNATMQCVNLSSLNEITINWIDQDGAIVSNNNTLILPNVVPSLNNTDYTCTAEVDTNPVTCLPDNKTITIDIKGTYVNSVIITFQEQELFLIDSSVIIECTIILNTPVGPGITPNVTWYHDITNVTQYSSLTRNNNDIVFISTLTIDSIQVSDAGVYQCSAGIDSNVTTNSISVCVTVNETLPSVTEEELSLGQDYSIDCINGPVPNGVSVSWLLTNGSIYSNNNTLMIPSILPSHNNTQYTCTVMIETNPSDCSTQSQVITFRVKATYVNSIAVASPSVTSLINSSVLLTCTINLNTGIGPDTSFISHYWYKDVTDISNRRTQLMINGDSKSLVTILNITNIQPSDAGEYQCKASIDGNDTVISNTARLCIQANETLPSDSEELSLGQYYSIDCITGPVPPEVSVSWLLTNGSIYSNSNTLMIPSILPSHNNTQYTCRIMIETNPSDCSTQSQTITLRVKATYINSVTITSSSVTSFIDTTVELTCTISLNTGIGPDTSFINHYWYYYKTDISNRSTQLMISGDSKSLVTTLNITGVQLSDAGVYQCGASIDGNNTVINSTEDFCIKVPVLNILFDTNLRLGDIKEYDCTLGHNYDISEVTVSWHEHTSDTFITEVMTNTVSLNLSNTSQDVECHITTNTDINTTNTDINTIVKVSWYRYNSNGNRLDLISDSEGISILPIQPVTNTSFISALNFSPITSSTPVSTLGNYTCVAWIGKESVRSITSNDVQVMMKINNTEDVVSMSQLNKYYTAGDSFNVTCMITAHQLSPPIATKGTVNITHNKSVIRSSAFDIGDTGSYEQSLDINSFTKILNLSQSGNLYNCSYIRNSTDSFVQESNVISDDNQLNIKIPINSTSLELKPTESYYEAGTKVTLSCKVTEPDSPLVDVDTTVNIKWSSDKNIPEYSIHPYNEYFNYPLTNITLSDAGEYNCTYYLNTTTDNPYIVPSDDMTGVTNVTIKIPKSNDPSITPLNSYYNVGHNINLTCFVPYLNYFLLDIDIKVNIQWLNSFTHTLHSYTGINNNTEHTISYTINNVSLSDAGEYTCQYNISSINNSFVLPSDNMRASTDVSIQIPNNKIPVINLIPHQSEYIAGSNITLSCSVTYPYFPFIDVDTNLTLQWFNSSNDTLNSNTIINDYNGHTLTYTISNARLSDAGQYTCSFFINTSVPYIVNSNTTRNFTIINIKIPNDITPYILVHPSKSYYNVNDNITLSCIINYTTNHLIDVDTTVNIQWLNDSLNRLDLYTELNDQDQHTFKYNISSLNLTDAGRYTCSFFLNATKNNDVIDHSEINYNFTSITVKIPNGEIPSINQLKPYYSVGDSITLTCSATYPSYIATNMNMQWLNSSNHTLHSYTGINNNTEHTISYTINNVSLSDAGEYTCQYNISSTNNSFVLPSDNMRASINVSIQIPNNKVPVINLIPHQSEYIAGSNITLSCSVTYLININTNLTLQWFNPFNDTLNSSTIINDNNGHTLTYTISNARLSDAGQYTCSFFINTSAPYIVNSNTTSNFITVNIKIPNVLTPYILAHPSKSYYNVNDNITLSCIINYTTDHLIDVNTTVNIQWLNYTLDSYTKLNDQDQHTFKYNISSLNLTDAGRYTCSFFLNATKNNDVIDHSETNSNFTDIIVMLPKGTIPSITLSQDDPLFGVGSNAILSCSVYYAYSSFIDVDTTVHIQWKHNGVLDYQLSDVNNEEYTCESYLSAADEALAVPVVVGFIFFGIILLVIIGVIALIICWLKIRGLKPSGVKESKELYTFSRELTKEDTDITETYALTLTEESLYQNVKASASTHKRPINSFPSFVKSSKKEIEDEYEDIETLAPSKSDSIAKSHALKNRFQNISPFDDNIVPLVEIKGQEGSNYINASYVSGYCRHRAYIATQGPIPSTVVDFWRMVWEYKLPTIVMLTQLVEKGINKCACYWPEDLNSEQDIGEGMKLTLKSEENQSKTGNKPIVVICNDGVGCSGTFLTAYSQIERAKTEGVSDIFQFIRKARSQRPGLVDCLERYIYCHELLCEYAEGMLQHEETSYI
uniref:Uncharacterized protein n=1 Tax=Amphimedon queenslandica TaxID=400682 RepID=A0A1X7V265_AMPQE